MIHDAYAPPAAISGQTCKGCINLSYHRSFKHQRHGDTLVGTYHCYRYERITSAAETPRPETEDCYSG